MSLRWADVRFVLARPPRHVLVLGALDDVRQAMGEAGIAAGARTDGDAIDLVIAPGDRWAEAVALNARAVVAIGRVAGVRRPPGPGPVVGLLARPDHRRPRLIVPWADRGAVRHVLGLSIPASRPKALWRAVAAKLVPYGILPPSSSMAIAQADQGAPFLVAAATTLGVPASVRWALTLGEGDDLQRAVFHLFGDEGRAPSWVVKFARIPGYRRPFDDDEAGLNALAKGAPAAATRAPRLVGRLEVDGLHASVETAAPGRPLSEVLDGPTPRPSKAALIDAVADWARDLAIESRVPSAALAPERARLDDEVMAQWRDHPAAASAWQVVDGAIDAGAIPGVLQHNDLGSWNIAADGTEFTVLDWESARPVGLPLWDLVYFLTDALTALDGPAPSTLKVDRMLRLLGGRSPESPTLFAHVSRTAQALGLERGAVGSIVTLGWLHHALSAPARRRAVAVASSVDGGPALGRLALGWLTDPALGSRWRAWSQ